MWNQRNKYKSAYTKWKETHRLRKYGLMIYSGKKG